MTTPQRRASLGLAAVILSLAGTFAVGLLIKAPCASATWTGQQYTKLCYTDIIPLYDTTLEYQLMRIDTAPGDRFFDERRELRVPG